MKYLLLADLHGNYRALDLILAHPAAKSADRVIIAGDIIGGAHPDRIIDRVKSLDALMVYGNSEEYLFRFLDGDPVLQTLQWAPIRETFAALSQEDIGFIKNLPPTIRLEDKGRSILVSHAVPHMPWEVFAPRYGMERLKEVVSSVGEDIFITGHSHIQWDLFYKGTLGINPGSVAYPIGYRGKTDFALLTLEGTINVDKFSLDFDVEEHIGDLERSGYLERSGPLGQAQVHMMRTGETVPSSFLRHIREKHNLKRGESIPDEFLYKGLESFEWDR